MNNRIIKKLFISLAMGITTLGLVGCSFPFGNMLNSNDPEISYVSYDNKANSTEEILQYLREAISQRKPSCEICVSSEDLINSTTWIYSLPGIQSLNCPYRKVKDGYNIIVNFEYWDYYSIIDAYKSKNTSGLNERQTQLYNKYVEVINQYTSPSKSDFENELAIHDYLVENVEYIDLGDAPYNAYDALINGKAVCRGYAECFMTFMDMLGIENSTLVGKAGDQLHIWNAVKLGNQWYHVDVTWDDPIGSTLMTVDHSYFNISDADISTDHSWDTTVQTQSIVADGTTFSYINMSGISRVSSQNELNLLMNQTIKQKKPELEFITNSILDLKTAMQYAGVALSYSYKNVTRNGAQLYIVAFNYEG